MWPATLSKRRLLLQVFEGCETFGGTFFNTIPLVVVFSFKQIFPSFHIKMTGLLEFY